MFLLLRHINVSFFGRTPECDSTTAVPEEYIIFCDIVEKELRATSIAKWDENTDQRVWAALGKTVLYQCSGLLRKCIRWFGGRYNTKPLLQPN